MPTDEPDRRAERWRAAGPVAIVFFPESPGITSSIRRWQARNPDWRRLLPDVVACPVCGLPVRAIADFALLDDEAVRAEVAWYRDTHLRAACSAHAWPPDEYWDVVESRTR